MYSAETQYKQNFAPDCQFLLKDLSRKLLSRPEQMNQKDDGAWTIYRGSFKGHKGATYA